MGISCIDGDKLYWRSWIVKVELGSVGGVVENR